MHLRAFARAAAVAALTAAALAVAPATAGAQGGCPPGVAYCIPAADLTAFADPTLTFVALTFTCQSSTDCIGTIELRTVVNGQTVPIGSASIHVPAGQTQVIKITLNVDGKRILGNATSRAATRASATRPGSIQVTPVYATQDANGITHETVLPQITLKVLRRPNAASVSVNVSRRVLGAHRTRYLTTGTVRLPAPATPANALTKAQACFGFVGVRVKSHGQTVSFRVVPLATNCTYRSSVSFSVPSRFRRGHVTVTSRFLGNPVLGPRRSRARPVRVPFG